MAATIQARSTEMQSTDTYIGGYVCHYITIYGTLKGRKLTITKVDLNAYHYGNSYNTNNAYYSRYNINGWVIGDYTIKGWTSNYSHVSFNGTLWTGTKEMELPKGATSIPVNVTCWDQAGRNLASFGERVINLGATAKGCEAYIKRDNVWEKGSIFVKANDEWKEADTVYLKINTEWIMEE